MFYLCFTRIKKGFQKIPESLVNLCSEGRTRTYDLRVMSLSLFVLNYLEMACNSYFKGILELRQIVLNRDKSHFVVHMLYIVFTFALKLLTLMASLKIVLRTNYTKKDGTCPLAIRITKDRKTRFIFTGKYLLPKNWDKNQSRVKKSHSNSSQLNNYLLKRLSEANAVALEIETKDEASSTKEIKQKVQSKKNTVSFYQSANIRIQQKFDAEVFSVARAEQSILNNIQKFHKKENLSFEEITTGFISKFKVFCKSQMGQSTRTITNQLIFIRTLFNIAMKDGLVDIKHYPFAGEKEKIRLTSGNKIGLTSEEIERVEVLELEKGFSAWHSKNIWLFAYYFAGMRISDVLAIRWGNIVDGRLFYVMEKNEKPLSLQIPDQAAEIIDLYKDRKTKKTDYIFPFLKKADQKNPEDVFIKIRNASRLINKYLKRIAAQCEIDKTLSNHIARHSFGNIAGDAINPLMLQKLYRHSDLKTTINYQANFIHKEADEALSAVLDFGRNKKSET